MQAPIDALDVIMKNEMKIEKFEDIRAWQIARELVREVYRITNDKEFVKDFGLKDQIRI